MEEYFIHYADPGFPEDPWPGERRSGPYSKDAALEQAINDVATGYGVPVGIYSDDESLKRISSTARSKGKAEFTASTLKQKGEAESRRRKALADKERADETKMLAEILPTGMGMDEAIVLLTEHSDKVKSAMAAALEEIAEERENNGTP